MSRFKKMILFGLSLMAALSFAAEGLAPIIDELKALERMDRGDERDRALLAYVEKYFSPRRSIEDRVESMRELASMTEDRWSDRKLNYSHVLLDRFNDLSEGKVNPSKEVRQSLADCFVGSLKTLQDYESFFRGVRRPPGPTLNSYVRFFNEKNIDSRPHLADPLEALQPGFSKSVFQRGLEVLKQVKSTEDSKIMASELMDLAVSETLSPETSKEDLKFLWSQGAEFSGWTLRVMSEKLGTEANNLFVSKLGAQRGLNGEVTENVAVLAIQNRLSDSRNIISDEVRKKLQEILSEKNITPEARAVAYRVLQSKHPKSVEDSPEKLLNSKETLDHLVASQVLGDKPEFSEKLTELLQKDLLMTRDPILQKKLASDPHVSNANWPKRKFTSAEREGVISLIKNHVSREIRKILDVNPELTGLLTQGLKKEPFDPYFNEEFAERLSKAIQDDPSLLTPELGGELVEILSSKDPRFAQTQNSLRKFMPENLKKKLDEQVASKRQDPSNVDPCEVTCRLADELEKKLSQSADIPVDQAMGLWEQPEHFSLAVRSISLEFLLKAKQTGCSVGKVEEQFSKLLVEARSVFNSKESETKNARDQDSSASEVLESLGSTAVDADSANRALAFLNRIAPNKMQESSLPLYSADLYFQLQTLRAMNAFQKEGAVLNQKVFDDLNSKLEKSLIETIKHRAKLETGDNGRSSSMLNTYAFAALGASASDKSPVRERVSQILSDWRQELEEKKAPGFPYAFSFPTGTERGGAARSAVAQLAIYKGGSTSEKLVNADKLLLSLQTYDRHFLDIFARVGVEFDGSSPHDRRNDNLAPYYGPPSLPYVFEAISLLSQEPGMTAEQKRKLSEVNGSILKKTLGMIQPNGLFQPQDKKISAGAEYYDNAFVGMALAQACTDSKPRTDTSPTKTDTQERKKTNPTH